MLRLICRKWLVLPKQLIQDRLLQNGTDEKTDTVTVHVTGLEVYAQDTGPLKIHVIVASPQKSLCVLDLKRCCTE